MIDADRVIEADRADGSDEACTARPPRTACVGISRLRGSDTHSVHPAVELQSPSTRRAGHRLRRLGLDEGRGREDRTCPHDDRGGGTAGIEPRTWADL